jgi:hypothetical protein
MSHRREQELLSELRALHRENEHALLTRDQATEARHTLLYASQSAMQLREYVVTEKMRWTTARAGLDAIIGSLEALAAYLEPGWRGVRMNVNETGGAAGPPAGACWAQLRAMQREP